MHAGYGMQMASMHCCEILIFTFVFFKLIIFLFIFCMAFSQKDVVWCSVFRFFCKISEGIFSVWTLAVELYFVYFDAVDCFGVGVPT